MTLEPADFCAFHAAVHDGKPAFAWQQRLLHKIVSERAWPRVLDLPTGSGKTTCIDVALFALALDATSDPDKRWCPRRIVMVVDRRIVVDQVAERGRKLLHALVNSGDCIVGEVATRLRSMSHAGDEPIGVFTLRGGIPKDDGWARTPDQPLIIASTVDQVGSRMLIQGYGVSRSMKPVHAGLLANDTVLLLDEVHLSEPFRQTLDQLARLRTRFSSGPVRTRFAHAFLSATPGATGTTPFSLLEEETAESSPLGARLHAKKPARLAEVDGRDALERMCVECATDLIERHRTVAVVVNRVQSAAAIAGELVDILDERAKVTLLTGRMRPLDREDVLRELRPAVQTGRERSAETPKRMIVATQCIEAGADFDFDAIVTESASLDSLRQRFGRLDRLGTYGKSDGVIIHDRGVIDDPIYGKAIVETIKWLKHKEKERSKVLKNELKVLRGEARKLKGIEKRDAEARIDRLVRVDFGILALRPPTDDLLSTLLAPKPNAPTLLPAYLDLWAQTSPPPSQVPDVSLWLHGPAAGPPDVQVVWRADLTEEVLRHNVDAAIAIVASLRPSSLEALSLPFVIAKTWLAQQPTRDLGDTEGATIDEPEMESASGRSALRWRGDESAIVNASTLKPGDTVVVPVTYGGIRHRCFDPTSTQPVVDRAEQAELCARARPALRLHPAVLDGLRLSIPLDDADEARGVLMRMAASDAMEWPEWMSVWAAGLAAGRGSFVVPGNPSWTVLQARKISLTSLRRAMGLQASLEDGVELTTDGDDSFCAGRAVSLAEHSGDVERFAREYANRSGLCRRLIEHMAFAAWLHDIGKADRRFQLMLRGGSEVEFIKDQTPWAKSAIPLGARAARRMARIRSGYPGGGHLHAIQSVAMLEGQIGVLTNLFERRCSGEKPDTDLILHLVASHHGDCRPFAPAAVDERPVGVALSAHSSTSLGSMDFPETTSDHKLYQLDAPIADRFWRLVERYGWLELCWLEAILRLADHRASEDEQTRGPA